jgi:hypothetical protein
MNIFEQIKIYTVEYFQELGQLLWDNKTRLLSVIILLIILVPAVFVPRKEDNLIKNVEQTTKNFAINLPEVGLPNFTAPDLIPKTPLVNVDLTQNYNNDKLQARNSPFVDNIIDRGVGIITDTDKVRESLKVASKVRYEGKISWADNLKSSVYADKFNINSSVKITFKDKSYIKNIEEKSIMTDDNLLLVSKAVFDEIGGDSKAQKSITVTIEQ